jgi:initiation factor 1A
VIKMLGNGRLEAMCFDGHGNTKRLAHIRGKLRKKVWVNQGDSMSLFLFFSYTYSMCCSRRSLLEIAVIRRKCDD